MNEIDLKVRGIEVKCLFDYDTGEPQTWDHPGYPDQVYVYHVIHKGVDIRNLLSDSVLDEIEERALQSLMEYER